MEKQASRNIAILGCGWLGLPLAELLVQRGYQVKGSTTRPERIPELKAKGVEAFLINVGEALRGENLDSFFTADTLIINIPPGGRRDPAAADRHPQQIRTIVEAARRGGVRRILFVSSTGVYGDDDKIVTEEDPLHPTTASGQALATIEEWLVQQPDFEPTILRLAGLVGGERKAGRFLAGKTNVPNGTAVVNLIHRDDCIHIIYEILRQEAWGEVFNACADLHPSRRDFYTHQAQKEGFTPPTFAEEFAGKQGKVISNQKLKRLLNYRFLHPDPMAF